MPDSRDYVWEKMHVAVMCLCGRGTLETRLADAAVSALMRLNDDDLDGELGDDLKYVLQWTKHNLSAGDIQKVPKDLELKNLIEKMLHILHETTDNRG